MMSSAADPTGSPFPEFTQAGRPAVCFVIFASPKSGTTWLQRMLSAHPDIVCGETRPFGEYFDPANPSTPYITLESYLSILARYHPGAAPPSGEGETDEGFRRKLLFAALDAIANTTLQAHGKRVYGEKITPARGTAAPVIQRLFEYDPSIRFIHLVRDGRDVLASGLVHQMRLRAAQASTAAQRAAFHDTLRRRELPDDDLDSMLDVWRGAVGAAIAADELFANRHTVRYEDLLVNPCAELSRILTLLDVRRDHETVERIVETHTFERMSGGRDRGEEDQSSFFRKGIAGDWKSWFSSEQAARFDSEAGNLLDQFGYDRAASAST